MNDDKEKLRAWVETWRETGKVLEKLRREEMREESLPETILALTDASESALRLNPPVPTSGLIEMQRKFLKLRSDATDN